MSRDPQHPVRDERSDAVGAEPVRSGAVSDPAALGAAGSVADEPDVVAHEDREFEDLPWCIACSG